MGKPGPPLPQGLQGDRIQNPLGSAFSNCHRQHWCKVPDCQLDKTVPADKLPKRLDNQLKNFIDAVDGKAEIYFGMDDAIDLARLLENAYISDEKGITVEIKN